MLTFQKTELYKEVLETTNEIINSFGKSTNPVLKTKLEEENMALATTIAKAFKTCHRKDLDNYLEKAAEHITGIVALLDIAEKSNDISSKNKEQLIQSLDTLQSNVINFRKNQKRILILSAELGQGHISAASAIQNALEHKYGCDYHVEIIDYVELLSSLINLVTKKSYEKSVKFAPSVYKFIFDSTNTKVPVVKLLNQVNYPFVLTKLMKFFEEKNPDLLISTFPIWNYLAADVWKKYRKNAKFISVVTDSISIHNSWVIADTDYHIVANQDTAASLTRLGVEKDKIKTLGFPVRLEFLKEINKEKLLKEFGLNPKNMTVLFLPTSQNLRKNTKILKTLVEKSKDINVIIITGRDSKMKLKPSHKKIAKNIKVLGWTDRMAEIMKASDIVITKAGGATTMECIAVKKPMIITSVIPGQEEGNAELIKRYNLGIIADAPKSDIGEHIDYIKNKYSFFQKNLEKISRPKAALEIAEFIAETLEKEKSK